MDITTIDKDTIERARKIKLMLLDVDGVLTDGRIIYNSDGTDSKFFDVHDGMGIALMSRVNIPTILISARSSRVIKRRAKDMQVERVYEDANCKIDVFKEVLNDYKLPAEEICFIGDDLVDLAILKKVGLAVAVRNACSDIKETAHYVTKLTGGKGAVREVVELIMKSQGLWNKVLQEFS